jgi:hypothetical protein
MAKLMRAVLEHVDGTIETYERCTKESLLGHLQRELGRVPPKPQLNAAPMIYNQPVSGAPVTEQPLLMPTINWGRDDNERLHNNAKAVAHASGEQPLLMPSVF